VQRVAFVLDIAALAGDREPLLRLEEREVPVPLVLVCVGERSEDGDFRRGGDLPVPSQNQPQIGLSQADLPHAQKRPCQVESRPSQGFLVDLRPVAVLQSSQRRLVDRVGARVVALLPFPTRFGLDVVVSRPDTRFVRLDLLEIEDVREVLDGDIEDVGEETQLVEGGIALAAFVARQLRVVNLAASRLGLVLDSSQRETVPNPEPAQVVPQARTSPQLLFHLSGPPTAALRCSRSRVIHYTLEPTLRRFIWNTSRVRGGVDCCNGAVT